MGDAEEHPFIEPINCRGLEEAAFTARTMDCRSADLKNAEQTYIRKWRKHRGDSDDEMKSEHLIGLAFSGGGIRSASFSLGIMQALARWGVLKKIDYLSTVSGGGYIGSALTWLLSGKAISEYRESKDPDPSLSFGPGKKNLPFGTDDPAPAAPHEANANQRRILNFLRDHGYYLTPGAGIGALSLVSIVIRGTFLNLLVWLPICMAMFVIFLNAFRVPGVSTVSDLIGVGDLPVIEGVLLAIRPESDCESVSLAQETLPPTADPACGALSSQLAIDEVLDPERRMDLLGFEFMLWAGITLVAAMLVLTVFYSLATRIRQGAGARTAKRWYVWRRRVERFAPIGISAVVVLLALGSLPIVVVYLQGIFASAGPLAVVTGMGVVSRYFLQSGKSSSRLPPGILVPAGAGLFLYGVALVSLDFAIVVDHPNQMMIGMFTARQLGWFFLGVAIVTGVVVNLNHISIHRYYRDRLMETFMPNIASALLNKTGMAVGADSATLQDVSPELRATAPYHIINTNVVLVNSDEYKERGGDNFMLSPLYCGSNATGWCPTTDFMGGNMTVATAVAISGAAANPNTGVGGKGITRNRVLSLVMSFLNLRLGYWATHPDPKRRKNRKNANHFSPGIYEVGNALSIRSRGLTEKRAFVQLSDGGHFENTAVYELVRRRMRVIIVCDGGADPEFSFSDFQTTVRRIEDDFGARIRVFKGASPDDIVPVDLTKSSDKGVYPRNAHFAKQGHMIGEITYADGSSGVMIFLKTTLIEDVSYKVKGYAAENSAFPDQPTTDQFFDEVQFESYRELGFRIADRMLHDDTEPVSEDLREMLDGQDPPADLLTFIDRYCAS